MQFLGLLAAALAAALDSVPHVAPREREALIPVDAADGSFLAYRTVVATRTEDENRGTISVSDGPTKAFALALTSLLFVPACYYGVGSAPVGKFAWGLAWFGCVLIMNVANKKAVMSTPTALTMLQMAFATVTLLLIYPALGIQCLQDLKDMKPWLGVCVFFVGMLVSSNFGFKFEEISTVVMMGSLRPMYAHALEWLFMSQPPTQYQKLGCVLLIVGSLGYFREGAQTPTRLGFLVLGLNGIVAAADRCYQRYFLAYAPLRAERSALVLLMNAGGLLLLLAAFPLWRGEVAALATRASAWASGSDLVDFSWVLLSCICGVAIGFAGIGFQKEVSASTFLFWATGSRLILISADHIARGQGFSLVAAFWLLVVVAGTVVHTSCAVAPEKRPLATSKGTAAAPAERSAVEDGIASSTNEPGSSPSASLPGSDADSDSGCMPTERARQHPPRQ
jgi:drug/metabolite transporter (DMT)-like permease